MKPTTVKAWQLLPGDTVLTEEDRPVYTIDEVYISEYTDDVTITAKFPIIGLRKIRVKRTKKVKVMR